VDKTGRTSVEWNEVMEEMRNYFQELAKENTIVTEETDPVMSDERDEDGISDVHRSEENN
jgi:hypothetical protein